MGQKYFGRQIEPACSYCRFGSPSPEGRSVLCTKRGVVAPYFSCRSYGYDPLKRRPSPQRALPRYNQSDFDL